MESSLTEQARNFSPFSMKNHASFSEYVIFSYNMETETSSSQQLIHATKAVNS